MALSALLPVTWVGWWTPVLADIVNVPLQPLIDGGVRVGDWVRPAGGRRDAQLQRRIDDLEAARALLHAERLKNEALREQIRALEDARRFSRGVEVDLLYARVTGRPPDRGQGPVRVNAGSRDGVTAGTTIAVFRGVHLLGRVADGVGRFSCRVIPTTDPAIGLIEAVIIPADNPVAPVETAPRLQLAPDGRGGLAGDLDREAVVSPGDVVRLADAAWPDSAQGMILGLVESIEPRDLKPLLVEVTVRPRFHAQRVAAVTLKVERSAQPVPGERP